MSGLVVIEPRKAGTWTLTVKRDGVVVRQVSGIPSLDEARSRASFWRRECGYRVRQIREGAAVLAE